MARGKSSCRCPPKPKKKKSCPCSKPRSTKSCTSSKPKPEQYEEVTHVYGLDGHLDSHQRLRPNDGSKPNDSPFFYAYTYVFKLFLILVAVGTVLYVTAAVFLPVFFVALIPFGVFITWVILPMMLLHVFVSRYNWKMWQPRMVVNQGCGCNKCSSGSTKSTPSGSTKNTSSASTKSTCPFAINK